MDNYQKTFETWNKVAKIYQEKFMDLDLYDDTYDRFLGLMPKSNASIFEIGCGPGNITRYLLSKKPDLNIFAIDVSPNMIRLAQENNPKAKFSCMDCREIGSLNSKFDAIISGFCMPYLSKADNEAFIRDCSKLLRQGGVFYFSTIKGNYSDSGFVTASTGDKSYMYYYDEEYLKAKLEENQLELLELNYKSSPVPMENSPGDMVFIARKN